MNKIFTKNQLIELLHESFDEYMLENKNENRPFLMLKMCKFNIINLSEIINGYATSILNGNIEHGFLCNQNTNVGYICEFCNRKVAGQFYFNDLSAFRVLRGEDINLNCEEFIIKNIIE